MNDYILKNDNAIKNLDIKVDYVVLELQQRLNELTTDFEKLNINE